MAKKVGFARKKGRKKKPARDRLAFPFGANVAGRKRRGGFAGGS
jgi:hypothetical protein